MEIQTSIHVGWIDAKVEVDPAAVFAHALQHEPGDTRGEIVYFLNRALLVTKAIPDEGIATLSDSQRLIIARVFEELAARFRPPAPIAAEGPRTE